MNMKKLLFTLTIILNLMAHTAPVANAQSLCGAGFVYSIGTITPNGASVSFYDSSYASGNITSYSWSFGNGTGSTLQNPVGYLNPGGNYVCLTITSVFQNQPCTSTFCDSIYIGTNPACNANFIFTPSSPLGVQFGASVANNVAWSWIFGDGTTGIGLNVFHAYANPGTYTVCLIVTDVNGQSCTSCQVVTVPSTTGCQAYFTSAVIPGTTNYVFTNQSQGNSTYFFWNFNDGSSSNLQSPTHSFNTTGYYNVCLTVTDSLAGCSDTYCDSIFVNGSLLCDATFGYQSSPNGTVFYASSLTSSNYTWDFGDSTSGSGGPVNTHVYSLPGTYNACLTVTNANGQTCTSCQMVTIQGTAGCSSNFAVYPDSILLHTYYAYNLAGGIAPLTYVWSWGDGTSSNVAYPSHTYAAAGLYTICLTITDATGCTSNTCYQWQLLRLASNSIPVTINVIPGATGLVENSLINGFSVYPNPATDYISASFSLLKESALIISIMNLAGQTIQVFPSTPYAQGTHDLNIDASGLSKGMYVIQIQSEGYIMHQKVIIQ